MGDRSLLKLASQISSLTLVNLSGLKLITDKSLKKLAYRNRGLTTIWLTNCDKLSDAAIAAIAKPTLRAIGLGGCTQVTDRAIKLLATNCPKLTRVGLTGCISLTNDAVKAIAANCPLVKSLGVEGCPMITRDGLNVLNTGVKIYASQVSHKSGYKMKRDRYGNLIRYPDVQIFQSLQGLRASDIAQALKRGRK